jgi:multidrug efflux pump subunit AcrB
VFGVLNNLWQTCLIVLAVVVAFLGLRTGLIVGAMVPLVMLISTLVMRQFGVELELERMSLAALIISLGLLVDNGIVVAEDMQGRLQNGQERIKAAIESGRTLLLPLLAASATTILAFMPLMLAPGAAGEYTRSIALVITIALSWVAALTILLLMCVWFMKAGEPRDEGAAYRKWYYDAYRGTLRGAIRFRWVVLLGAVGFLVFGGWMFQFVGKTFFPASERTQLQVIVELPVGANTMATTETVDHITQWLSRDAVNPEVDDVVGYIASGGPRFYLSLAPVDGYPNNTYLIVNVKQSQDVVTVRERLKAWALVAVPEARVTPKEMSMGPSESGLVEFRLIGQDSAILSEVIAGGLIVGTVLTLFIAPCLYSIFYRVKAI